MLDLSQGFCARQGFMPKAELDKLNEHLGRAHELLESLGNDAMNLYLGNLLIDRKLVRQHQRSLAWHLQRVGTCLDRACVEQEKEAAND